MNYYEPSLSRCSPPDSKRAYQIGILTAATLALLGACAAAASATDDSDWLSYNRNYEANRFSPLNEISRENVRKLTKSGATPYLKRRHFKQDRSPSAMSYT